MQIKVKKLEIDLVRRTAHIKDMSEQLQFILRNHQRAVKELCDPEKIMEQNQIDYLENYTRQLFAEYRKVEKQRKEHFSYCCVKNRCQFWGHVDIQKPEFD